MAKTRKRKSCCKKCNLTWGCMHYIDAVNAEESLYLLGETFETLFNWYDNRSESFRKRANPKMWAEIRRQWKACM